jgi:RNA polymerase sigma-70 factor (ECF subfamily)
MSEDEDSLAARARAGDAQAFDALVRREKAALYNFVRRYVGNPDQAYDILQDTFVAAWRALGRYDAARPFGVWLRRIALNKCRDHGRRIRVRRLALAAFALEPQQRPAQAPPPRDGREDRLARLDRAIARLPTLYKDPLLLTTAGGLSHEAAASVLGVSAKAVEMRLYRARQRLAEILQDDAEG